MKLLRSEYQAKDGKPIIYLFLRNEEGKREIKVISDFAPYFYIPADEEDVLQGIRMDKNIYEAIDGTRLRKVYVSLPEDVPELRKKYSRTFEGDILFGTRYLIDEVDKIEPTLSKVLFIDIEVDNKGKVPDPKLAIESIICIGTHDNLTNSYNTFVFRSDLSPGIESDLYYGCLHEIHYFKSEKELLRAFVEFVELEGPDIISGWNVILFDLTYILNRLKRLGINANKLSPLNSAYTREHDVVIKGIAIVDLYSAYRKLTFSLEESYRLDYIANKVLGEGKLFNETDIRLLWRNQLDKLILYNLTDVRIVMEINRKLRLLEFLDELRRLSFCQLEDTLSSSRISDCYILKLLHNDKVLPTKEHHKKYKYEGAYVESWAEGIYENIASFDLKSLYPNIICTFQLSPESIISEDEALFGNVIHVNNTYIRKGKNGFLPRVIEKLFKERDKYKKLMNSNNIGSEQWNLYYARQYALKILLNSLYGQTAFVGSRIYEPKIAEATAYLGKQIIKWSKEFLENIGYNVLYVDTDSIFLQLQKGTPDEAEEILALVNSSYIDFVRKYGLDKHRFEMEFEVIYQKIFFGKDTKKRYVGHIIYQNGKEVDYLSIVGMDTRRSDNAQFSRNLQKRVFDMLLRQNKPKNEVINYIGEEIDRIRKGNYTLTEIGIPKGISRELESYETKPANIRGAIYSRDILNLELSSKPKMIYVSKVPSKYPQTDVICFDEDSQVPPGTEIDTEKMLEKLVKAKVNGIFEALGWSISELDYHWRGCPRPGGEQLRFL